MSKATSSVVSLLASARSSDDLFAQTLRMVALLVVACVLFVGTLSAAAVAITSKAVGAPKTDDASSEPDARTAAAPKKPLSI